ncbi:hypothetical protein ES703_84130 [subsurface metagenome]
MINEKTITEIVQVAIAPIMEQLTEEAKDEVAKNFCQQQCGHGPEGNLCLAANREYERCLRHLFEEYVRFN